MFDFDNAFDELQWRGAISDFTADAKHFLVDEKVKFYVGFDPTSDSLHIGSLLPLMCMARLQRYGHAPIVVLGGGTGRIGDPSGRSTERQLLSTSKIDRNCDKIRQQIERVLNLYISSNPARIINNAEWIAELNFVDFMRDIGKSFMINKMMKRHSFRERVVDGMSFAEFSYPLLQANDFLTLYERENCTFQIGGSDQWGNIIDGIDLIRRRHGSLETGQSLAHGVVFPLITDSNGEKLGKSRGTTQSLDANKFSPYKLYQFLFNTSDADVIRYIKLLTWLTKTEIENLECAVIENPKERLAQRALAVQVVNIVHGAAGLAQAVRITRALFNGELESLSILELNDVFDYSEDATIIKSEIDDRHVSFASLAVASGAAKSLSDARRTVSQGGMYLNSERMNDASRVIVPDDIMHESMIVIRRGRRDNRLIRVK